MNKLLTVASAALILFSSCQVNYKKTATGLKYKIYDSDGKGEKVTKQSFVKFDMEYRIQGKDSVLFTTFGKMPTYSPVDTTERSTYSFMEVLPGTRAGDSIIVVMSVDSLKSKHLIPDYDNTFKRGDNILGKIKILGVYNNEQAMMADYQKEMDAVKQKEINKLQDYITKNNIKAQKTKNGVFVDIKEQGNGEKADSGKAVTVYYKCYLLDSKKLIDTNMDSSFQHPEGYQLVVGAMQAIPGWDEALPYFNAGGKGILYVPSLLAYGAQGRPPVIPGFSNLMFEMEVREVKAAPATPTAPVPGAQTK